MAERSRPGTSPPPADVYGALRVSCQATSIAKVIAVLFTVIAPVAGTEM